MSKIILANWKQYPSQLKQAISFINTFKKNVRLGKDSHVLFAVPDVFLSNLVLKFKSKKLLFGVQRISAKPDKSLVGEISAEQAKSAGAIFAVVSHPSWGENLADVNLRLKHALAAELAPVVVFGESKRDEDGKYLAEIENFLKEVLSGVSRKNLANIIFIYEPAWVTCQGGDFLHTHGKEKLEMTILYIKKILSQMYSKTVAHKAVVLYAGCVNKENAAELASISQINGVGVGSASQNVKEFVEIVKIFNSSK